MAKSEPKPKLPEPDYSPEEIARRRDEVVRAMLKTPPKPRTAEDPAEPQKPR